MDILISSNLERLLYHLTDESDETIRKWMGQLSKDGKYEVCDKVKAQILAELVKNVYPKIVQGLVKPTIHAVLPITDAEAAHNILYKGQNVGKVVLTLPL